MRSLWIIIACLWAGQAFSQGVSPDADSSLSVRAELPPKGASAGLVDGAPEQSFQRAAGVWVGQVQEIGVEQRYTAKLRLRENGAGEVHYMGAGYDCRGVLAPLSAGEHLVFVETITLGRDQCSDGRVYVTLYGDEMEWLWGFSPQELYASATLARQKD